MTEPMTRDQFHRLQDRIHAQDARNWDAWVLLCEVRRLQAILQDVMILTGLNENLWDTRRRLDHAEERLDQIREACRNGFPSG